MNLCDICKNKDLDCKHIIGNVKVNGEIVSCKDCKLRRVMK
jgi:hypothetical protein